MHLRESLNQETISMKSSFCKFYAAATCMLMAATALCADSNVASRCAPSPCVYPPSPCCEPICNQGPYCGPNCLPYPYCSELNIKGGLLFWRSELCGLEAAFGDTTVATTVDPLTGVITTEIIETDQHPDFKWSPGFRIGADYAFTCFVLEADWTHYKGHAKFSDGGQHGRWKIDYDTLDLIFGRRCCVAPCFYFKPFIGLRGALIHQTLTSHLETLFTTSVVNNTVITDKNDKERFWGIGPELGVEANWYLGCDFSVYGNFDFVTYYGGVKSKNYDVDIFPTTVSISNGKHNHCFSTIGTDMAIGLRWDKRWCVASEVLLMLKLGLEQHRIYDFSELGSDGTLSFDGGIFEVGLGYRY